MKYLPWLLLIFVGFTGWAYAAPEFVQDKLARDQVQALRDIADELKAMRRECAKR